MIRVREIGGYFVVDNDPEAEAEFRKGQAEGDAMFRHFQDQAQKRWEEHCAITERKWQDALSPPPPPRYESAPLEPQAAPPLPEPAAPLQVPEPAHTAATPEDQQQGKRILKRKALIKAHEHEWHTISADLNECSRNGLTQAAATGEHGMWDVDKAFAWAESRGKIQRSTIDLLWPGKATRHTTDD